MKISEKTYPGTALLTGNGRIYKEDAAKKHPGFSDEMRRIANENRKDFNSKCYVLSEAFIDAFDKAETKLALAVGMEPFKNITGMSGTLFHGKQLTYRYKIGTSERDSTVLMYAGDILVSAMHKGMPLYYMSLADKMSDNLESLGRGDDMREFMAERGYDIEQMNAFGKFTVTLTMLNFIRCAEVQTKTIRAGAKATGLDGLPTANQTGHDVTLLDSHWFTEIVRTDGFAVRGHFRMQPHGPNLEQRKLIWVADFKKNGYHRRAGIQIAEQEHAIL